jgi:superfamily I DNA/RNA helicase
MTALSAEQQAIVDAPLVALSVIACAGSGKTRTAVHRLAEIRKRLGEQRGRVALLSFSNIAVDTFRANYQMLAQDLPAGVGRSRVEIDTLDGFITGSILRPHANRTMGATQAAYLVTGSESFLNGFTFKTETYPLGISDMQVGIRNGEPFFYYSSFEKIIELDTAYASRIIERLGRSGAYTHNLGRYWCYRTLRMQPAILRVLAHRYPHILIDEAQDIGVLHQAILDLLASAGVHISLIGDPNQGIYEFAGADGKFLSYYAGREHITAYALTQNYRSTPTILDIANKLSARNDTAIRQAPQTHHGAFFVTYKNAERQQLIDAFQAEVLAAGLNPKESAIVCRSRPLANELGGNDAPVGQGLIKGFAAAAVLRDKRQDYRTSFKTVASCIIGLLENPPQGLLTKIIQPAGYPEMRALRREIWTFTRNLATGLPSSTLVANTKWHPLLLARIKVLLSVLQAKFGFAITDNLGRKLAKTKLPNAPLMTAEDLIAKQAMRIRVDTVHQVKGESLDAVLYVAAKDHVQALLAGVDTEVGRIGYVAITRAKNLLWLGVPANAIQELRPALLASGFKEAGIAAIKKV